MESESLNGNELVGRSGHGDTDSAAKGENNEPARRPKWFHAGEPLPAPSTLTESERTARISDIVPECQKAVSNRFVDKRRSGDPIGRSAWGCVVYFNEGIPDGALVVAPEPQSLLELLRLSIYYPPTAKPRAVNTNTAWRVSVAIDGWRMGAMDWQKLEWSLRVALCGEGEIRWIGPFEELLSGGSAFAQKTRRAYREGAPSEAVAGCSDPSERLGEEEVESFLSLLGEHKIPECGLQVIAWRPGHPWWIRAVEPKPFVKTRSVLGGDVTPHPAAAQPAAVPAESEDSDFGVLSMLARKREGKRRRESTPMPDPAGLSDTERHEYIQDFDERCKDIFFDRCSELWGWPDKLREHWGYVLFDGGGTKDGGMMLAPDRHTLVEVLRFWIFYPSLGSPDFTNTLTTWRLSVAIDGWRLGAIEWAQLEWALHVALSGYGELCWIGPVEELLTGDSSFAREARQYFRERLSEEDSVGDGAFAETEVDGFLEQMLAWGAIPMFGINTIAANDAFPSWIGNDGAGVVV